MEWYLYVAIVVIGIIAGYINTLAGSGSLLTLPLLMFVGLPATVANGTNRIGILFQNLVAVKSFKDQKIFNYGDGFWLAVPAAAGSLLGSVIAVNFNERLMSLFIGGLLVVMFFLILLKPESWLKERAGTIDPSPRAGRFIIFFLIGIYGGFIQAGVGFFLLAGLIFSVGADLVLANALKVFIVLIFTVVALVVFFVNQQVDIKIGLVLAAGNMIGAWIGSRNAVKHGPKYVRVVLLVAILISALKLLGAVDFLIKLL